MHDVDGGPLEWLLTFLSAHASRFPRQMLGSGMWYRGKFFIEMTVNSVLVTDA